MKQIDTKTKTPIVAQVPESQEYYFKEGCYILELWNDPRDADTSIARARVEPGITTRLHALHHTTERYLILEGRGQVFIGENSFGGKGVGEKAEEVQAGSVVFIPPNCPQQIKNIGDEDLIFLAICSPRFKAENYQDLERD